MLVERTDVDGVVTLTLNRPDARNALNLDLIVALRAALDGVRQEPSARVVVVAGAGKSFCAGMDLRGVMDDPATMGRMLQELAEATVTLRNLHCPTIAAVQGAAVGGGCGLAVVCDFAISHAEAKLGYPEVDLGVCPAVVAPWLIRKIGAGRARAMLLRGGTISGTDAAEIGLVDQLAPAGAVMTAAREVASRLSIGGKGALAVTKRWLNELDGSWDSDVVLKGAALSAAVIQTEEAQTRVRERMKP